MEKGIQPSEIDNMDYEELLRFAMFTLERERNMMESMGRK